MDPAKVDTVPLSEVVENEGKRDACFESLDMLGPDDPFYLQHLEQARSIRSSINPLG